MMQLNLTRSSIKNKLFQTTKELKELTFQQNVRVEFIDNDVFKNEMFAEPIV